MKVPSFLSHLRTDRRGLPVPFVNRWGVEEHLGHMTIRHDPHVGRLGFFYDDLGPDGPDEPDFTSQNIGRQREAMARGLCQVCGREVPWSRRNIVLSELSVERIDLAGVQVPVVIEPWLDDRCAAFALHVCPALIRRRRDEELELVPVRSAREVKFIVSVGWMEGELEVQSRADPPAMWVKLALLRR